MDMKSFFFIIAAAVGAIFFLLGLFAVVYEGLSFTNLKPAMDFIFAVVIAFMGVLQYKVFESAEKSY